MDPDLQELGTDCERDLEIAKSLGSRVETFSPCKIKKKTVKASDRLLFMVDAGITTCWVTLILKRLRSTRETELGCFLKLYANVEQDSRISPNIKTNCIKLILLMAPVVNGFHILAD